MTTVTVEEVQELAGQLSPHDQAKVISYLSKRLAQAVEENAPISIPSEVSPPDPAWQRLQQIGDQIAASPQVGLSLTEELFVDRQR